MEDRRHPELHHENERRDRSQRKPGVQPEAHGAGVPVDGEVPVARITAPGEPREPDGSAQPERTESFINGVPVVEPLAASPDAPSEFGKPGEGSQGIQALEVVAPVQYASPVSGTDNNANAAGEQNPISSQQNVAPESTVSPQAPMQTIEPPVVAPASFETRATAENQLVEVSDPADRSWVFRCFDFFGSTFRYSFGIVSIVLLLAITANIPILQLISFGYLLEVTGRLARGRRFKDSFVGLSKASRLGSALLGAYLCLLPARLTWVMWYDAMLIDPASSQTTFMRVVHLAVTVLMVAHILAAWFCGGKLRYFFWPLVAPFSFAIWIARKFSGAPAFRRLLEITVGWLSPHLVDEICNARPISDFFLPAILWKRLTTGNAYVTARDGLWDFVTGLRLRYYFELGFRGFTGTMIWLIVPTLLLFASTEMQSATGPNGVPAILCGVLGLVIAVPVFSLLPFVQAHFATDGRFRRFFQPFQVIHNWGRAPILHLIALLITLLFALPLFLLKIVEIPPETLWGLSIIFIIFSWPARIMVGWAYGSAASREKSRYWFIRWPALMAAFPLSFIFVFVMFFSRYVTWNGAWSLIENHVFLLPAPYWLG